MDEEEVPDYRDIIKEPMDLETMMTKIDQHEYECAQDFLRDIDLICTNALEYNPDRNPEGELHFPASLGNRNTSRNLLHALYTIHS